MRIGLDLLSEVAGRSSGTETYLTGFLNALREVNEGLHEFYLFVNAGNQQLYAIDGSHFCQVRFPSSNLQRALRVLTQLALIPVEARRLKLDVVNFLGTTGAFGVGCATVQHIKTLHHIHYPEEVTWVRALFRRALMGPSARSAEVVIANSAFTREGIIEHLRVAPERVIVVPEAVDHAVFVPKTREDTYGVTLGKYGVREPYILFVSSLWPYKNAHGLIKAFASLVHECRAEQRLVIIGGLSAGRYQAQLRELVIELKVGDRVQFLGHVGDRREIRDFYIGANAFVYPSYAETFGLTVLEAMACGVPVVASDRTSVPEVAGGAALLADPGNYHGLASAIQTVLTDEALRLELRAKGLRRAAEFTWERTARSTLETYKRASLLRGRHSANRAQ
jgi:glycosyltransferase involved in cell wall biosynthesis